MGKSGHRYDQVRQELLGEVRRGEYSPGDRFLTERQVCARFGVSTTTAVRALNELVRQGALVRRQGSGTFVAPRAGRPGADPQSDRNTVACLVSKLHGQHTLQVVRGVESVCREAGYHLLLFDSDESAAQEASNVERALGAGAAGLIVFPVEGAPNTSLFGELLAARTPLVMVDRYYPSLPTDAVVPDNFDVGYRLTEHLIGAGRTSIATLWGEIECTSVQDRAAGYRAALQAHGVPLTPEFALLTPYERLPDPDRKALLRRLLALHERPTAFLAGNGFVLALAAADLAGLGVNLSTDIALGGMDDVGPYDLLPLADIAAVLPSHRMGAEAVRLLVAHPSISGEQRQARHVVLPVGFAAKGASAVHLLPVPRSA